MDQMKTLASGANLFGFLCKLGYLYHLCRDQITNTNRTVTCQPPAGGAFYQFRCMHISILVVLTGQLAGGCCCCQAGGLSPLAPPQSSACAGLWPCLWLGRSSPGPLAVSLMIYGTDGLTDRLSEPCKDRLLRGLFQWVPHFYF